ncbi:MAG: hypothetical protein WD314_15485 [Trueperaceae bacterium]
MKYSEPRFTKDLDLLIAVDDENSRAIFGALKEFGAPLEGLSADDFAAEGYFYQMGSPPLRVDVMMSVPGLTFENAWSQRETVSMLGTEIHFVSKDDLIRAKLAAGRPQDLLDAANLKNRG